MRSRTFSVAGANIKGTPSMPASSVRNDVRKISKRVDVMITQEFKWRWYWVVIRTLLGVKWRSFPSFAVGVAQPIKGAQGIFWKKKLFSKVGTKLIEAFDFDLDNAGIMDNRWIRAVCLEDARDKLQCWFVSLHNVVGADASGDSVRRKMFMSENLDRLDTMLGYLTRSDAPIIVEGDFNIHAGTWAYVDLMRLVKKHHGRVVGTHGVEFMIIFDHHCSTKIRTERIYSMNPKEAGLKTDHEVRCLDFHLERTA